MHQQMKGFQPGASDRVLCVQCSDEHLVRYNDGPLINAVLDTVRNELEIDHFYIAQTRTVLVRVNNGTLDNPILRDW
jgi:hypothetical protein